jgi:hypothetical protein
MFWRNILAPSSGWVNVVQMDAEVIGRKECVSYVHRFEGMLASQSHGRQKSRQGL